MVTPKQTCCFGKGAKEVNNRTDTLKEGYFSKLIKTEVSQHAELNKYGNEGIIGMKKNARGRSSNRKGFTQHWDMSRTRHGVTVRVIPIITCDSLCDNFLFLSYDL